MSGVEVGRGKLVGRGAISEVIFVIVLLGLNLSINIAIVFGVLYGSNPSTSHYHMYSYEYLVSKYSIIGPHNPHLLKMI